MTTKQLVKLLIACAVLLVLAGLVYFMKRPAGSGGGGSSKASKVFADLDVNDIQGLRIGSGEGQTEIQRKEVGETHVWAVVNRDDYPANEKEIREFVVQLRDLEKQQSVSVPEAELGRFGLTASEDGEEQPLQVELLKNDGSVLETFLLGGSRQSGDSKQGRYVRVGDGKVHLVAERFSGLKPEAGEWLSKDFFKVEKIKSAALFDPNPKESWKVERADTNGEFVLADAKPEESADPAKTSSFKWMMGSPSFDDVLTAEEAKKINFGMGGYGAEITTFDGFKYVLSIAKVTPKAEENAEEGEKAPDPEYYLKVDVTGQLADKRTPGEGEDEDSAKKLDEQWASAQETLKEKLANEQKLNGRTYRIAEYTVSSLLKKRSEILKTDEPAAGTGAPGAAPGIAAPPAPPTPPAGMPIRPGASTAPVQPKSPTTPGNPVAPKAKPKPEMEKPAPAPQSSGKGSKGTPQGSGAKAKGGKAGQARPESPANAPKGKGKAKSKAQPKTEPAMPAAPEGKPSPAEKPAASGSDADLLKALEDLEQTLEDSKKPQR